MGLSCACVDGDFELWYESANDFSQLDTKRCRRCSSCKSKISVGATVLEFSTYRNPTEWEYQTLGWQDGDEVQKAPKYLCEPCGEIYLSLDELGFCGIGPDQSMTELLEEYHETYGRETA